MAARQFWRGLLDADNPIGIYKKESKLPQSKVLRSNGAISLQLQNQGDNN
jgi:hypothetical protein